MNQMMGVKAMQYRSESKIKFLSLTLLLCTFVLISSACRPRVAETGFLEGQVTIGPLVPVVRAGEEAPTPSPEVYAARQVVIFNARTGKELQRVVIDSAGHYQIDLPVGIYTVDINRTGIDSATGLPTQVNIKTDQTFRLDIDIDTGIR